MVNWGGSSRRGRRLRQVVRWAQPCERERTDVPVQCSAGASYFCLLPTGTQRNGAKAAGYFGCGVADSLG